MHPKFSVGDNCLLCRNESIERGEHVTFAGKIFPAQPKLCYDAYMLIIEKQMVSGTALPLLMPSVRASATGRG